MHIDTTNVEHEMDDCTVNNWRKQNIKVLKPKGFFAYYKV